MNSPDYLDCPHHYYFYWNGICAACGAADPYDYPADADDVGALEQFVGAYDIKLLIIDPVLTMLGGGEEK